MKGFKQLLAEVEGADARIKALQALIRQAAERGEAVTRAYSEYRLPDGQRAYAGRVGTSNAPRDPVGESVAKIDEYQRELLEAVISEQRVIAEFRAAVSRSCGSREQAVLLMRAVGRLSWGQIAERLGTINARQAYKAYVRAVRALASEQAR